MDKGYALDCLADPQFHDSATIETVPDGPSTITRHKPACGWRTTQMGDWLVLTPEEAACRHRAGAFRASACLDYIEQIVETIPVCTRADRLSPAGIRNLKYAARRSSGEFVTIFPVDERRFERIP